MGHDYLAINDGVAVPTMNEKWGVRYNNGWGSTGKLFGKSTRSDLTENALNAIATLIFHASEQLLDHPTIRAK